MKSLTKMFYFHAIDTFFYVSELVNNAKDFETAQITTPVRSTCFGNGFARTSTGQKLAEV